MNRIGLILRKSILTDGIIINNLSEYVSNDDVKALVEGISLNSSENVSIHPTGSARGRIIKDVDINLVSMFVNKYDNKSFKGKIIMSQPLLQRRPKIQLKRM